MKSLKIVLDTSIFVNPDSRTFFGKTPQEALLNFLDLLKDKENVKCYIPPSVYEELMKFIDTNISPKKIILIHKKPPSSYQVSMPALLFYEFIEDIRLRINKGLRVAEKYTRKGLRVNLPQDSQKNDQEIIKSLREEFRIALREGIVDSKEDFDLMLLAKELDACLATSDKGLIKWAHKLGISCLGAAHLKELLQ